MSTITQARILPFEAKYGYSLKLPQKDETYAFLKGMISDPNYIRDCLTVVNQSLPKAHEKSQSIIRRCETFEHLVSLMRYELETVFKGDHPDIIYFKIGLQIEKELEELERLTIPKGIKTLVRQYNSIPIVVLKSIGCYEGEVTISDNLFKPIPDDILDKKTIDAVAQIFVGMVKHYEAVFNTLTAGRVSEAPNVIVVRGKKFALRSMPDIDNRIEVSSDALPIIYRYLNILTANKHYELNGTPMLSQDEVDYLYYRFFKVGVCPEKRNLTIDMSDKDILYFFRKLYDAFGQRKDMPAYREILTHFTNFSTYTDKSIQDKFNPKENEMNRRLITLTRSVLMEHLQI